MDKYAEMVTSLAKSGLEIQESMTPDRMHLIHMILGISGEAGELLDGIKKAVIYNKPLDIENIKEELGDLEFYMEGLRQGVGLSRQETLEANYDKLARKRYKSGTYSDEQAQARADKN